MMILGIDPAPQQSAAVLYDTTQCTIGEYQLLTNEEMRTWLHGIIATWQADTVAIEGIASYGKAVGAEIFETCIWIGRFWETILRTDDSIPVTLIYRKDIKIAICGSLRATDATIRQAIIDQFGGKKRAIGLKKMPGPLYGIKLDLWSALAVALVAAEQETC